MHPWAIGVFMGLLSGAFGDAAFRYGGGAWVLAWPAMSAACVAVTYFAQRPAWLGKRGDGTRPAWAWLLYAPYFAFVVVAWSLQKRLGEAVADEVAPGIHVARRAHGSELPAGLERVVDMTAEFGEPDDVRSRAGWTCLPTLDASAPAAAAFGALVAELAVCEGPVWIHCASGHGRSATLAAAVIIRRGLARDAASAEALMRRARPAIGLKPVQRALVDSLARPGA